MVAHRVSYCGKYKLRLVLILTTEVLLLFLPLLLKVLYSYLNALRAVRHRALSALMRSVLDSMLVTVAMLKLCICLICDSGAGGESSASRIKIPQGSGYV